MPTGVKYWITGVDKKPHTQKLNQLTTYKSIENVHKIMNMKEKYMIHKVWLVQLHWYGMANIGSECRLKNTFTDQAVSRQIKWKKFKLKLDS